ncbi:MAG: hypothetical protein PHP06_04210 [Clostridia bacterium]|nr:hypothetical protein [Clostridia bacterium]
MKIWAMIKKDNELIDDLVVEKNQNISDKELIEECMVEICYHFDIEKPMWLNKNHMEFIKYGRTSFISDNFIDSIYFDRLEIEDISDAD